MSTITPLLQYSMNTTDVSNNKLINTTSGLYDASLNSTGIYISDINYKVGNGSLEFPKNTITFGTRTTITTPHLQNIGVAVSQDQLKMIVVVVSAASMGVHYAGRTSTSNSFSAFTLVPSAPTSVAYRSCAMTTDGTRGVTCVYGNYVYVFFWAGSSSTAPSGWKQTLDTTARNYEKVSLTSDGSRMVISLWSSNIYISTWNSSSSNYNAFTQSVLTSFTAAISLNGDRLVYSNSGNENWYLAFWNGTDYVGNTLTLTKGSQRHAFFSGDSSILYISNYTIDSFAYGIFNQTTKKYENFQSPSTTTTVPASSNLYGFCFVDGITSGALYCVTYGTTTMYVVPVNYTILDNPSVTRYVTLPSFTTTNNGLTFSFWFESNYNPEWSRIFDFGNGAASDNIFVSINSNCISITTTYNGQLTQPVITGYPINDNKWYHLAFTLSYVAPGSATSNLIVYLNGVSISNTSNVYYPLNVARTLNYIGRSNWSNPGNYEFFGNIDEFRMYNTVLSASQVQDVYNNISLVAVADANSYNFEKALSLDWNGKLFVLTVRKDTYMGSTNNKDYLYSYDGTTWTTGTDISNSTILVNKNPYNVKWLGNQYEIMGNITSTTGGNTILKSRDGTSFSSIPANNSVPIYDLDANLEFNNTITFPKDVTLALGGASADSTKIAYSLDGGITWTPSANSAAVFSNTVYNAAWNGKLWVAVGSGGNTIATSTDGNQWIGRGSYIFTTAGYGIAWSNEQTVWIACGEGTNSLAYSYDGIYWSGLGNTIVNPVYDVEWNGSIWVAGGSPISGNKSIAYSYDGLNWQLPTQTNLFDISAQRLFWNGSFWVGIGKSTTNNGSFNMATSVDGQTWNMINNTSFANEILTNMYSNPKTNVTFFTSYVLASPPTNLSATSSTGTTISISFTAPTTAVTTYTVTAVPTSGTTVTQTFNAPATTYTITGLQTLVQYTISIFSTNAYGNSLSSTSITYNTIVSSPTNLSVTTVTSTSLTITFTAPTMTIDSYSVTATNNSNSSNTVTQTFSKTLTTYTITGLNTNATYTIQLFAIIGIYSSASVTTTGTTNKAITMSNFNSSTVNGSYTIYSYTSVGTFNNSLSYNTPTSKTIYVIQVAGGGAGGNDQSGGGGGGGVIFSTLNLTGSDTMNFTIGAGGTRGGTNTGGGAKSNPGGNTVIASTNTNLTAIGGGAGQSYLQPGTSGGSGGGGRTGYAGTAGQGYAGGSCTTYSDATIGVYGGGGGAGGVGQTVSTGGGAGGPGAKTPSSLTGFVGSAFINYYWGGGGGGGWGGFGSAGSGAGNGGIGGGGGGASNSGGAAGVANNTAGAQINNGGNGAVGFNQYGGAGGANTGGGGGGGSQAGVGFFQDGGLGGSGIIVVAVSTTDIS